jgi:hypothetical protein
MTCVKQVRLFKIVYMFFRKKNYSGLCKSFAGNQFLLWFQPLAVFFTYSKKRNQMKG